MEWTCISNQQAMFIKIDFEKAYDRIEWLFILSILRALGFSETSTRGKDELWITIVLRCARRNHLTSNCRLSTVSWFGLCRVQSISKLSATIIRTL